MIKCNFTEHARNILFRKCQSRIMPSTSYKPIKSAARLNSNRCKLIYFYNRKDVIRKKLLWLKMWSFVVGYILSIQTSPSHYNAFAMRRMRFFISFRDTLLSVKTWVTSGVIRVNRMREDNRPGCFARIRWLQGFLANFIIIQIEICCTRLCSVSQ